MIKYICVVCFYMEYLNVYIILKYRQKKTRIAFCLCEKRKISNNNDIDSIVNQSKDTVYKNYCWKDKMI